MIKAVFYKNLIETCTEKYFLSIKMVEFLFNDCLSAKRVRITDYCLITVFFDDDSMLNINFDSKYENVTHIIAIY